MRDKIVVGITQGDTNGIGYEVIIKSLADARILENCVIILYGSSRFFGIYRKFLPEIEQIATNVINAAEDARTKRVNIINAVPESMAMEIGQPTPDGAKAAVMALKAAVADAKRGAIDAIVTAPFNKHTVAQLGFGFPGHTEYLIHEFEQKDGLMFLCSENLRVGVVTNHLPLAKVSAAISVETIMSKLRLMDDSLRRDLRTDVVVKVSDDKYLVIDSKNTVDSYVEYVCSEGEDREAQRHRIVESLRGHVDELKSAAYQRNIKQAFDFVFMYIPFEEVYLIAMKAELRIGRDRVLLREYARRNGVVFVNATSLLPTLRLVAMTWAKQDSDAKAAKIKEECAALCRKFETFLATYERIGKSLAKAMDVYGEGLGQLAS